MNENIQKLYSKVLNESAERWNHPDAEKFARLIIEECADLFPHTFTDEHYQRRIDKTIRKHFGVAE
jgi:phosphoribosyl-ATP pyrophosphohydrolase